MEKVPGECLPGIQIYIVFPLSPDLLADSLQKVGSVSRVQTKNREVIYRLVCELRDAAQGHNPLALPCDHVDDVEVPDTEVEKAVERLEVNYQ